MTIGDSSRFSINLFLENSLVVNILRARNMRMCAMDIAVTLNYLLRCIFVTHRSKFYTHIILINKLLYSIFGYRYKSI